MTIEAALLAVAVALALAALALVWRQNQRAAAARAGEAAQMLALAQTASALQSANQELTGRLAQLAADSRAGQAELAKMMHERLDQVSQRMGQSLEQSAVKTAQSIGELQNRLVVIDAAQKNISELTGQVVSLQDILSNKQARGAFGEIQLNDLVVNCLPPSAYEFQAKVGTGRADCLIKLPNPPGAIVIDAKFPLESFRALRAAADDAARAVAGRAFSADILKHVRDISEKYIVAGETAESALMFVPSEAVYAELHANFGDVVDKSFRARVWIVSPTTLMATLNTVRAVLKDARMREAAGVIQKEVGALLEDINRLDDRVENLRKHFGLAEKDIREIETSAGKITRRAEKIEDIQLEDAPTLAAITGGAETP